MQDVGYACFGHTHFTFNHRDARTFQPAVDCEHRACDRYQAIFGRDIKMSAAPLGCLHNDVAAIEIDGGVFAAHGHGELRVLIHLHHGTIGQAQHCVAAGGSPYAVAFHDLLAEPQPSFTIQAYQVESAAVH